jgi:hypothetical protein
MDLCQRCEAGFSHWPMTVLLKNGGVSEAQDEKSLIRLLADDMIFKMFSFCDAPGFSEWREHTAKLSVEIKEF